jgi:hypothetical protein
MQSIDRLRMLASAIVNINALTKRCLVDGMLEDDAGGYGCGLLSG